MHRELHQAASFPLQRHLQLDFIRRRRLAHVVQTPSRDLVMLESDRYLGAKHHFRLHLNQHTKPTSPTTGQWLCCLDP